MSESTYDLIIVGGGPAGAGAALYAHRQGLRALILERATFPRDKSCGDSISGKSLAILHELELLQEVTDLPGTVVRRVLLGSPDGSDAVFDLDGETYSDPLTDSCTPAGGLMIQRLTFDALLFERAREVSAGCVENVAVRDLMVERGIVKGVLGQEEGTDGPLREFRAPLVLGCDGAHSTVAHRAGVRSLDARHTSVARRAYYEGLECEPGVNEVYFTKQSMPGYLWIFPLGDGRANVGAGMLHSALRQREHGLEECLRFAVEEGPLSPRFAGARPIGRAAASVLPMGSRRRPCSAPGVLLLGDAAGLIDPFSGEGIGNALYSARLAVDMAVEARDAGDYSGPFLEEYSNRLWGALGPELKISAHLQWAAGRWPTFLNRVVRKAARRQDFARLLTNAYTNVAPRSQLVDPLLYLKALWK